MTSPRASPHPLRLGAAAERPRGWTDDVSLLDLRPGSSPEHVRLTKADVWSALLSQVAMASGASRSGAAPRAHKTTSSASRAPTGSAPRTSRAGTTRARHQVGRRCAQRVPATGRAGARGRRRRRSEMPSSGWRSASSPSTPSRVGACWTRVKFDVTPRPARMQPDQRALQGGARRRRQRREVRRGGDDDVFFSRSVGVFGEQGRRSRLAALGSQPLSRVKSVSRSSSSASSRRNRRRMLGRSRPRRFATAVSSEDNTSANASRARRSRHSVAQPPRRPLGFLRAADRAIPRDSARRRVRAGSGRRAVPPPRRPRPPPHASAALSRRDASSVSAAAAATASSSASSRRAEAASRSEAQSATAARNSRTRSFFASFSSIVSRSVKVSVRRISRLSTPVQRRLQARLRGCQNIARLAQIASRRLERSRRATRVLGAGFDRDASPPRPSSPPPPWQRVQ